MGETNHDFIKGLPMPKVKVKISWVETKKVRVLNNKNPSTPTVKSIEAVEEAATLIDQLHLINNISQASLV